MQSRGTGATPGRTSRAIATTGTRPVVSAEDREECLEILYRLEKSRESPTIGRLLSEPDLEDRPVADVLFELALDREVSVDGDSVRLTPAGREVGRRVYGRHQLIERLLCSLGLKEGLVHSEACRLEHLCDDSSAEDMARRLDRLEAMMDKGLVRLRDADPGRYRLILLSVGGAQRRRLEDMGLCPGTRVQVHRRQPYGPVEVEARGVRLALGRGVAAKILVMPEVETGTAGVSGAGVTVADT